MKTQFLKLVDESIFTLEEWQDSLAKVKQFLLTEKRTMSEEMMLGYIVCCAESAAKHPGLHRLPELVEQMLAEHGMD